MAKVRMGMRTGCNHAETRIVAQGKGLRHRHELFVRGRLGTSGGSDRSAGLPEHATSTPTLEDDLVAVAGLENLAEINGENLVCLGKVRERNTLARLQGRINLRPIKRDRGGRDGVLASTSHFGAFLFGD